MITKNISWSLGPAPNKSLETSPQAAAAGVNIEPSIPIHLPGDPLANSKRKNYVHTALTPSAPIYLALAPLIASPIALVIDPATRPLNLNNDNHLDPFPIAADRSDRFLNSDQFDVFRTFNLEPSTLNQHLL
jgi:hypothetical protein